MNRIILAVTTVFMSVGLTLPTAAAEKAATKEKKALKVGDVAPEFELKGSDGKTYKLSDFKDKAGVVVAWYPKALTGG